MEEQEEEFEAIGEEEFMETAVIIEEEAEEEKEEKSLEEEVFESVRKMRLPADPGVQAAYNVYKPSIELQSLLSEKRRHIFAEAFEGEKISPSAEVPKLTDLCLDIVLKTYTKGNIDPRLQGELRMRLGEKLDINLHLRDVIELEVESYWKKVFVSKCKNKLLVCQKINSPNENWKELGMQEKFRELLENTKVEEWNEDEMKNIARNLAPFVYDFTITQLTPLKEYTIQKDRNLTAFKIYNYPAEDCHHISLEILGEFINLVSLHVEFQPPNLGYKYDSRFFHFSYQDIDNLAK